MFYIFSLVCMTPTPDLYTLSLHDALPICLEDGLAGHSGNLRGGCDSGCTVQVVRSAVLQCDSDEQSPSCCSVMWVIVAPAPLAAGFPAPCHRTSARARPSRR